MELNESSAALPQVRLGQHGPVVSALGLDATAFAVDPDLDPYEASDVEQTLVVLHRALDAGVTLLDVADLHGFGAGEELVGQVLAGRRDEVVVSTRLGVVRDGGEVTPTGRRGEASYVQHACEASLRRLGTDVIDLYVVHPVFAPVPLEETVGAALDLVDTGKVRHVALATVDAISLHRACTAGPVAAVRTPWSVWVRDAEDELVPACRDLGMGVMATAPLGALFLSGHPAALEAGEAPGSDNHRKQLLLSALDTVAQRHRVTRAQVALAWVKGRMAVMGLPVVPVPGTRRPRWLQQIVQAVGLELTEDDQALLDTASGRPARPVQPPAGADQAAHR